MYQRVVSEMEYLKANQKGLSQITGPAVPKSMTGPAFPCRAEFAFSLLVNGWASGAHGKRVP